MGQPIQCNVCCAVDPPDPPIADCHQVICVAFIDENDPGKASDNQDFIEKMAKFIEAYDNRILFVMDVTSGSRMYYPPNFISHDKAFSLKLEYDAGVAGIDRFIERNGSYEEVQDAWDFMKKIVATKSAEVQALFNGATECAIFIDDSGSMSHTHVLEVTRKLKDNARADGVIPTASNYNGREDVICPFVVPQCCLNQAESDLRVLCGQRPCSPSSIEWVKQPDGAFVVDDPCNPADGTPDPDTCQSCPTVTTNQHTAKYTAAVKDGDGNILDFPTINYTIQARNTSADSWQDIFELPNGFSGTEQSFDTLITGGQSDSGWTLLGQELAGSEPIFQKLGQAVSINSDGNRIVVLERYKAKAYHLVDDQWVKLGGDIGTLDFIASPGQDYSALASQVAATSTNISMSESGDFVAIGEPNYRPLGGSNPRNGRVRIYRLDGFNWVQLGPDIVGASSDQLGWSVSIVEGKNLPSHARSLSVAIGSLQTDKMALGEEVSGNVKVYWYTGTSIGNIWTQAGSTLTGDKKYDRFGFCVSLYKRHDFDWVLAVGAPYHGWSGTSYEDSRNHGGAYPVGQVKVYENIQFIHSDWVQVGSNLNVSNEFYFGNGVDVSKGVTGFNYTVAVTSRKKPSSGGHLHNARVYD